MERGACLATDIDWISKYVNEKWLVIFLLLATDAKRYILYYFAAYVGDTSSEI